MTATTATAPELMTADHIEQYWEEGYTIIRDVFAEAFYAGRERITD